MHSPRLACLLAAVFTVVAVTAACVELTGQRIVWFHDEAADELRLLLFYDGIHDSKGDKPTRGFSFFGGVSDDRGSQQIPDFIEDGDVMLLDWVLYFPRLRMRRQADVGEATAEQRVLLKLLDAMRVEVLGHYREPDGSIGAAQWVVIPRISRVVAVLNAMISTEILAQPDEIELPRTRARLVQAAKDDYQWVSLNGHAIAVTVPVDPAEWARFRRMIVTEAMQVFASESAQRGGVRDEKFAFNLRAVAAAIASASISYLDEGEQLKVILGRRDVPSPIRVQLRPRSAYEPSLERIVRQHAGGELAQVYRWTTPVANTDQGPWQYDLLDWGPREAQVLAMLSAVDAETDAPSESAPPGSARQHLWALRDQWQATIDVPDGITAPWDPSAGPGEGEAVSVMPWSLERKTWVDWYTTLRGYVEAGG